MSLNLILGDCLTELPKIEAKSIDLVLCDPPYNLTSLDWDKLIPFEEMWRQIKRVRKDNCASLIFGIEPFSSALRLSNIKEYKYDWFWQKERPTNVLQVKRRPGKVIENICVFYKQQPKYFPQKTAHGGDLRTNKIKNGQLGKLIDNQNKRAVAYRDDRTRYPLQLIKFNRDILTSNLHPTQKPVKLLEYFIKTYTQEGDTVLDFCSGVASTGVACQNLNRNFIGIEIDPNYYRIACERLKNGV